MATKLANVIVSLSRQEAASAAGGGAHLIEGMIVALQPWGDHLVQTDQGIVVARSATDENLDIDDIVHVLIAGQEHVILGGKK